MKEHHKDTQSIFGEQRRLLAVSHHNVADLLNDLNDEEKTKVASTYSPRSGANDYTATRLGNVVRTADSRSEDHGAYLQTIFDKNFRSYTATRIKNLARVAQKPEEVPLVVPYFNGYKVAETFKEADIWGLPPQLVEPLKNKATFHEMVQKAGIEGFTVPEFTISDKDAYAENAFTLLQKRKSLYETRGLAGQYPQGLVVRLEESDGGYGSTYLNQEKEGIYVSYDGDYNSEDTKLIPLNTTSNHAWETAWKKAITTSRDMLYGKAGSDAARVVITPYLDIEDSPGMSMLLLHGNVYSLGWNGQLQLNGSKAAKGTSSYHPKNEYTRDMQQQHESRSAELAMQFMQKIAKDQGLSFESMRGIVSFDFMIPGELDMKLQGNEPTIWLAESNPRFTNLSDGVLNAIGATGREPTVSDMKTVLEEGIYTEDNVELHGADFELVRDIIVANDDRSKEDRVLIRMPRDPEKDTMGAIYLGDWQKARGELKAAMEEVKKLQGATTEEVLFVSNTRADRT